jgi:predicted nucleic acid-binding protein
MLIKIFVDSDVIISSLISERGAAYLLIHKNKLDLFVSNLSVKEIGIVLKRLRYSKNKLRSLIRDKFKQVRLKEGVEGIKKQFGEYVLDFNDAHIVAGAQEAKAKFLVSYNIKDFKIDKIKKDFGIIVTTPANFLQYLRSLS